MENRRVIRKKRRRVHPFVMCLFVIAFMLLLSSLMALIWQLFLPNLPQEEMIKPDSRLLEGPLKVMHDDKTMPVMPPPLKTLPMPQGENGENMGDRVRSDYFDDAVFIGDSITTGISLYEVMDNAKVYAKTGLGVYGLLDNAFIKRNGTEITISQALSEDRPGKIYVMLGGNSMGNYNGKLIEPFKQFIEQIAKENPQSTIYIQSVLPVNEAKYREHYGHELKNSWIEDYNSKLKELSEENGYYYLDVASVFRDENGEMPSEYTRDGVHIGVQQYAMWFDYLKENTAEKLDK